MTTLPVTRTEPDGPAIAVAWRRLREVPWLAVPLALGVAAPGLAVAALVAADERLGMLALIEPGWVAIVAALTSVVLGRRFHRPPAAPDDDPKPIAVQVRAGRVAASSWPRGEQAHALPGALRIVDQEWVGRDLAGIAAGTALAVAAAVAVVVVTGAPALVVYSVPAFPCLAWAFGFPRRRRVALDLPWDDVTAAETDGLGTFRVVPADGSAPLVLTAKYSHRWRLTEALRDRLGERFRTVAGPVEWLLPPPVSDEDADAGVAELAVRRLRGERTLTVVVGVLGLALLTYGVGTVLDSPRIRFAAAAATTLAGVVAIVVSRKRRSAWRRIAPAADDSPSPIPVRWTNAPGWIGPRGHGAHVLAATFRVVRHEWEMWDILVVGSCALVAGWVGGLWPLLGAIWVLGALGFPRRRRIVADIPWEEITSAEIRGTDFDVRSRLPEPADLVRLEAKYGARERLTAALVERLGSRAHVDVRIPAGKSVPTREPTPDDLAARAQAVRDLAGRGGADCPRP